MEGELQTAMKAVGQAIRLDDEGKDREAYYRYLACTQFISQGILQESKNQGYQAPIKTKSTVRMLKLAQQCVDRAVAIMDSAEEQTSSQLAPPAADHSGRFSPSVQTSQSVSPPNLTAQPGPGPRSALTPHPVKPACVTAQNAAAALPVPVGYTRPKAGRKDKLTPLEAAYLENQRIMNSYRARLAQVMENRKGKGHLNKTTLNLTLQRRLMENLAIARAREAALAKKIQERHRRLQEEAVSRFSTTGEPTRAEIELRQIYASVMEFESNEDWLTEWRRKLHESPLDLQFIHALIGHILACAEHPFTQLLQKFQYSIYQSLLPLVQKDAQVLEQIKVPYKAVEPLQLSDAKTRVIPPDGFSTPGDLKADESLDEDLLRRLQALRNSSSEERRESLYSNMLATSPRSSSASSLDPGRPHGDEDEDEGMWDSADDTLEEVDPGPAVGPGPSPDSGAGPPPVAAGPVEAEASAEGTDAGRRSGDSPDREDGDESEPDLPGPPDGPAGESADGGAEDGDCEEADANTGIGDPEGSRGEGGREEEEEEDVVGQMRSLAAEVQENLREAAAEVEKRAGELARETEEALAEARTGQDGEVAEEAEAELSPAERGSGDDDNDDVGEEGKSPDCVRERLPEEEEEEKVKEGEEDEEEEEEEEKKKRAKEEEQERIARLQEEALQRHLKHISKDIQSYLDRLQSLLVAIYEDLDSAVAKEQCIAIIEKHFFRLIWQPLLTLFRRANLRKEISAATAMTRYQDALPENIGIIKKLCLTSEEEEEGEGEGREDGPYPYQLAVEELRRISGYFSPLEKLECVVKASRAIISCVGDYYEAHGESRENTENAVGCDDLLPILSFVVIKSALPHIVSECSIMEEFIHEGYLFGEEGYCLTTLQTSLGYVLKLAED